MGINYKSLGLRIHNTRKAQHMSQQELAELSDLSVPYISNIETGKRCLSLNALLSIANALNVSTEALLVDQLYNVGNAYQEELYQFMQKCTSAEKRVVCDIAISTINCIRKNPWLISNP